MICQERGTKITNDKTHPPEIFNRTSGIENFYSVKPSLKVIADKHIQERLKTKISGNSQDQGTDRDKSTEPFLS